MIAGAVSQNRSAVRLARLRYENGLDSILGVLDAERTLHENEALLADSTTAISIRLVALYKALGGGWDGSADKSDSAQTDQSHCVQDRPRP